MKYFFSLLCWRYLLWYPQLTWALSPHHVCFSFSPPWGTVAICLLSRCLYYQRRLSLPIIVTMDILPPSNRRCQPELLKWQMMILQLQQSQKRGKVPVSLLHPLTSEREVSPTMLHHDFTGELWSCGNHQRQAWCERYQCTHRLNDAMV